MLPLLTEDITWNDIVIREVGLGTLGVTYLPTPYPLPGGIPKATSEPLPFFNAVQWKLTGAEAIYPRFNYSRLPGVVESQVSGNVLTVSAITDFAVAFGNVNGDYALSPSATWTAILWSETYAQENSIGGAAILRDVTSQLSRRKGRGA